MSKLRFITINAELYQNLKHTKSKKMNSLVPDPPPSHSRTVVTIPEDLPLDPAIIEILSKGTKFIPTPRKVDEERLSDAMQQFYRKVRLHAFFNDPNQHIRGNVVVTDSEDEVEAESDNSFKKYTTKVSKSTFNPMNVHQSVHNFINRCNEEYNSMNLNLKRRSNVTFRQEKALNSLLHRDDLVVKQADKGGAIVVMTREHYVNEARRQLSDTNFYRKEDYDRTDENLSNLRNIINEEIDSGNLPSNAICMVPEKAKCGRFYLLMKIHKPNNPGRPVTSACSCPTEKLSAFIDDLLQPINKRLPSYVKDTNHLLKIYNDVPPTKPGEVRLLYKADVKSLYTVIPNNDGLKAIKFWLEKEQDFPYPVDTIIRLVELVLTVNHFEFDGDYYTQSRGVAMGTRMGPSYACLFMGWIEHEFFCTYDGPIPELYKRYIDDMTGCTVIGRSDLDKFLHAFGTFHHAVELVSEVSEVSLDTLDVIASVNVDGTLSTTIYYKPTDSHSYVHYDSNHPRPCLDSIPYSQFLRLRRICSDNDDFRSQCEKMSNFFRARSYPEQVLQRALERVNTVTREQSLTPKVRDDNDKTKLIIPFYDGISRKISQMVHRNGRVLAQDPDIGFIFKDQILTSYKNCPNIKERVIRSKLPSVLDEIPGNFPCGKSRCLTCDVLCGDSIVVGPCGEFNIKSSFTCSDTNVIYAINCLKCDLLYIGETGLTMRKRKNKHISDINCKRTENNEVAQHFCSSPHSVQDDFSIRAILRVHDQHERRIIEAKLIRSLGTLIPLGLNKEKSTYHR